ncbi:ferredoxin 2fe-2S-like protein [Angomonas deanei]|uniref:2Fe-2S iron-sulfur cluster binding domain containing protein, putative n=1 Tax=Angomonas deanei TaxID=59799 RepID=A0A7G2C6F3_9TRYP|nr:ferredoxin 2fe-2S-like protein [Angomonas deanei]CAD2213532.1 2Fe-2S iron-sulfur cluster binding domain containing protein, putative [Angomonas deanei]|eukprot:EPY41964.1 ferredoxin 2fe-2S-like protein [Angomonas deanei]
MLRFASVPLATYTPSLMTSAFRFCATKPIKVKVTVHSDVDKVSKTIEAPEGITLMEAIRDIAKLDMEAACDGTCACSTCHVILTQESYDRLAETPSEDEMDMLDLAPKVSKTSRLSCQVNLSSKTNPLVLTIPDEMENQLSSW